MEINCSGKWFKMAGYHVSFTYTKEDQAQQLKDIAHFRANRVKGLIIFPVSNTTHDAGIWQLQEEHFPFVLIDRYYPDLETDYVGPDNVGGGYRVLLILGHQRIGFYLVGVILLMFELTMQALVPIIPLSVLMVQFNLTDTYQGLILLLASEGLPLSIFIFWGYFQTLPGELHDVAVVDGYSEWSVFLRVIVPISGLAIASVCILEFLAAWNEYVLPLILITSPNLRTLPLAIQVFFSTYPTTDWRQVFAALTVSALPMILLYLFLQRLCIQALTSGTSKG